MTTPIPDRRQGDGPLIEAIKDLVASNERTQYLAQRIAARDAPTRDELLADGALDPELAQVPTIQAEQRARLVRVVAAIAIIVTALLFGGGYILKTASDQAAKDAAAKVAAQAKVDDIIRTNKANASCKERNAGVDKQAEILRGIADSEPRDQAAVAVRIRIGATELLATRLDCDSKYPVKPLPKEPR